MSTLWGTGRCSRHCPEEMRGEGHCVQRKSTTVHSENSQKHKGRVRNESRKEGWSPITDSIDCQEREFGLVLWAAGAFDMGD